MTNTLTLTLRNTAMALLALGFAVYAGMATPVHAQTTAQIQSIQQQIQALSAQLNSLQGQTSQGQIISGTSFPRFLSIGSRGTDVVQLQSWLMSKGYNIPAGATGYFGVQTRAALAGFQATNGISPAVGYFGPITRSVVLSMTGTVSNGNGTGTGSNGLSGGSGYLTNFYILGDINTSLNENQVDQRVVGTSLRAIGSDMQIQRVDAVFDLTSSSGSSNLNRYVQNVSLYLNGTRLATLDATTGDYQNHTWTFRFSNLTGVVPQNTTGNLYVVVTPVTSINTNEANQTVRVTIPANGIRAIDAQGVTDTYPGSVNTQTFVVSTASTGSLVVTAASDNPYNSVVKGDTSNTTTGITLLSLNLKARNQPVIIRSLPVHLYVNGTSNVGDVVQTVALMNGSQTLSTKTVTASGSNSEVVFDNLNLNIPQGSTLPLQVVTTIRKMGTGSSGSAFDTGDSIYATVGSSVNWDTADVIGNNASISGAATGGTITFLTTGISAALVNTNTIRATGTNIGQADSTQYAITFRVTAGDTDLYLDRDIQRSASPSVTGAGIAWATTTSSTPGVTNLGASNFAAGDTNTGDSSTSYKVPAGTSRTFTLNVTLTATGSGFTGVQLVGLNWDTQPNTNTSANYYTAGLDQFKTADVSMLVH